MDGLLNSAKQGISGMMGADTKTPPAQQGGSKYRKGGRKRGGSRVRFNKRGGNSVVATAALPFGLLALQKFFQTRKGRSELNQFNRTVKAPFTRRNKRRR